MFLGNLRDFQSNATIGCEPLDVDGNAFSVPFGVQSQLVHYRTSSKSKGPGVWGWGLSEHSSLQGEVGEVPSYQLCRAGWQDLGEVETAWDYRGVSDAEENGAHQVNTRLASCSALGKLTFFPGSCLLLLQTAFLEFMISVDPNRRWTYFNETLVSREYYLALLK